MATLQERIRAARDKSKANLPTWKREAFKPSKDFKIKNLPKQLYPYQLEGVEFLNQHNGNAILGDDMGLGKTAQIIAYLQHNQDIRPALVLCKSALKLKWSIETFAFAERKVCNTAYILNGRKHKNIQEVLLKGDGMPSFIEHKKLPKTGIFIINYDIFENWIEEIIKLKPMIIIIDEAQYVRSTKTKRWAAFCDIKEETGCKRFIPTTGTLLENRPMDIFNAINLVAPEMFPNYFTFGKRYCNGRKRAFGWDFTGKSNLKELFTRLSSIMIRRHKKDVLKDLPPKTRTIIPLEIDMKAYTAIEKSAEKLSQAKREMMLQAAAEGKLDAAMDWIEDFLSSGDKLVVFAFHKKIVNGIYEEFKEWAIKVDGATSAKAKGEAEYIFQNDPKVKLLVGNLKSAGEGLTLTEAYATATVELLDHSPSLHLQAEDRVLRIGQTAEGVFAYYFVAVGTIDEENIVELERRSKIASAVLDGKTNGQFELKED